MIELLLSDVDGTLVTNTKELTPRSIEAVHELHDAGIHFAVTSGRPPRGMEMLVEPLALRAPLAGFNGGLVVEPGMDVIEEHTIRQDLVAPAIELLEASAAVRLGVPGHRVVHPRSGRAARRTRDAHRALRSRPWSTASTASKPR